MTSFLFSSSRNQRANFLNRLKRFFKRWAVQRIVVTGKPRDSQFFRSVYKQKLSMNSNPKNHRLSVTLNVPFRTIMDIAISIIVLNGTFSVTLSL